MDDGIIAWTFRDLLFLVSAFTQLVVLMGTMVDPVLNLKSWPYFFSLTNSHTTVCDSDSD